MHDPSLERPPFGRVLPVLLLLLTVFGPISMDLYLPALPALTADLGAATSVAQLTVTSCLIGLAGGQLVAGPLSDRFGRRGILLVGILAYILTSALCAVSPTIELLIVARFAQGLAGSIGVVIAQAAGRDIYSGGALIRFYGRLTVMGGFAAVVGPLVGGVLTMVTDWRGLFVFLAAMGAGILLTTLVVFRETLPFDRRTSGGFRRTMRRLPSPDLRSRVPRSCTLPWLHVCRALRVPLRLQLRSAGYLRAVAGRIRARVRGQLRRVHGIRLPRRTRCGEVERPRHPRYRHPRRRRGRARLCWLAASS